MVEWAASTRSVRVRFSLGAIFLTYITLTMSDIIVYQKKVYVKANPQMLTEAQMEQIINGDVLKLEDTTPVPLGQVPPSAFKQYDPTFDPDPSVYGANSIVKKRQPLSKSNRKVYDFMVNHP